MKAKQKRQAEFSELLGKTLVKIVGLQTLEDGMVYFHTEGGT